MLSQPREVSLAESWKVPGELISVGLPVQKQEQGADRCLPTSACTGEIHKLPGCVVLGLCCPCAQKAFPGSNQDVLC